jgi:hypothetical protein
MHDSLGLARRVIPGGDFAAGLIELGFHLVLQFELVFEKVINPRTEFLDLRAGQAGNGSFNFLNCTHGRMMTDRLGFERPGFLGLGDENDEPGDVCFDARPHPGLLPRGEGESCAAFLKIGRCC